ncbi:hypothetical protein [Pseudovibrio sp. Ad26]|uniref:hypothetical protein n=1 Tax=Pseudovibrio sp. Ad26 TaxID=989410 RepID=UPI00128FEBC8|nr:hypothetical protein [Pseudovibrio sp. Ad26]
MANLICPVRGELGATYFAKDGLTVSEEARRIDCISFLMGKAYPKENIECETVVIKWVGNGGRNSLRADITIYDRSLAEIADLEEADRQLHMLLIAEIKRDKKSKSGAINFQLEPALRQIDRANALGVYWDDINRILLVKKTKLQLKKMTWGTFQISAMSINTRN